MALAAAAHTTLPIPLSSTSKPLSPHSSHATTQCSSSLNADSTSSSPWVSSLILSVPSLHHGAMKARVSATELSGRTWFAEQSIRLCTDNASMLVTGSFRVRVSSEPNSTVVSGKGLRTRFVSRNGNGIEGRRFDSLRPHAKPRYQTQQQQPRTDDDQQRPPPEPIGKLEPSMERYLQYLADYKIVYDTMEEIVRQALHPSYAIFWNSGLERSAALAKDFEWFRSQGHTIPQPNTLGRTYAQRLKYLSENDPPAFIYSVYNVFYAHSAGGRYIGRKVADLILDGRELNFYQFETDILDLIDAARDKLDKLKATWPKETRDRMLKETRLSYKWSADLVRKYIRVYDNELPEIHEDVSLP